jgi:hypothetical protein
MLEIVNFLPLSATSDTSGSFPFVLQQGPQPVLEGQSCPVQLGFDRTKRDLQGLADLFVRETLQVAQDQDLFFRLRHLGQLGQKDIGGFLLFDGFFQQFVAGELQRVLFVIEGLRFEKTPSLQAAIAVPAVIECGLIEPGREFGRIFQGGKRPVDGHEDVLGQILGFLLVFHITVREVVNLALIKLDQAIECLGVPLPEGMDKLRCLVFEHL